MLPPTITTRVTSISPRIHQGLTGTSVSPFVLSETPAGTKSFPQGHYLVPDTNAFLTAMDLFEVETAFRDVIVLQTVLEEVKNRSLPLYHRLISLTKNEDKRFYVFFNDFRQETYVVRGPGETINDRNDRAVRKAVQWYSQHLQAAVKARRSGRIPAVVMISDDRENLRKAEAEGISALSCKYLHLHRNLSSVSKGASQCQITFPDLRMRISCLTWLAKGGSSAITAAAKSNFYILR